MWTYVQRTGKLIDETGTIAYHGYAGHEDGVNNPALQHVKNVGPLPCGMYSIGTPFNHPKRGKYALRLNPHLDNDMYGRAGFLIHGDKIGHVDEMLASEGCIILPRGVREFIWKSGDHLLKVVSEEADITKEKELAI